MPEQPVLTVFAGPNGSGKSTIYAALSSRYKLGPFINADVIAKSLAADQLLDTAERTALDYRAMHEADAQREAALLAGRSFCFETVMSHPSKLDFMHLARTKGFGVRLIFVGLDNPQLNVARVRFRVARGGHAVPEHKIVERYHRTMRLAVDALDLADEALIFDNSVLPTLIAELRRDGQGAPDIVLHTEQAMPLWVSALLRRYADLLRTKLS